MEIQNDPFFIALYLPQFHPIEENNAWWGEGFTEWTNVTKASPLFKGHHQPILPTDLGYYDLRVPETRIAQASLAREHGIDGFCYYHYWFTGKRLLQRPLDEVVASGAPDFPFCLCWANETWSRRWIGDEQEILIKQEYAPEDDRAHAEHLMYYFEDERYIRRNGRSFFTIYRPADLPNPEATIETIKSVAIARGHKEPYIVGSNAHFWDNKKLLAYGFDAVLNFRPQLGILPFATSDAFMWKRAVRNYQNFKVLDGKLKIYTYKEALELMSTIEPETFENVVPCIFVGWDNTARRGDKGIIMTDNTPTLFEQEADRVIAKMKHAPDGTGILFINAWNEWAEGNKLEPDLFSGHAHLNTIKRLKERHEF